MSNKKYITFVNGDGKETGVVFDTTIQHAEKAAQLGLLRKNILGAGMLFSNDTDAVCVGPSTSLMVDSRGDADVQLLREALCVK